MTPILLVLALFVYWWVIGLGLLAAVRADLASLRVVLTAPPLGTASTVVALFVASSVGIPMRYGGPLVATALLLGAIVVVATRRPTLPAGMKPVIAACVGGACLTAWPFVQLGFGWIANANSDMSLYVLSATRLLHHGLLSPVTNASLVGDRDLAGLTGQLYAHGGRPGTDITLSALAATTGRPAYQVYMPLGVALNLVAAAGVAALTMQAARRWWGACVAVVIFAVAPLATFALVQQLVPQLWGLGLASALLALLLRPELHRAGGARVSTVLPIAVIMAALVVVYVELTSTLVVAYVLYVIVLVVKRQLSFSATLLRLWLPAIAIVLAVVNAYGFRDVEYVRLQVAHATQSAGSIPAFGYAMVPSALAAVVGLQPWNASPTSPAVGLSIIAAAFILGALLLAVAATFWRAQAPAIALAASALLGALLILQVSDFGLFKLAMFVQPFIAASIAAWLTMLGRRALIPVGAAVALVLIAQLSIQHGYIKKSLNAVDLHDASSASLLPAFERFYSRSARPVISITDNQVLAKLEASVVGKGRLYLISNNALGVPWKKRTFALAGTGTTTTFLDNTHASALLASHRCNLIMPSGSQNIINRRPLPPGSPDLVVRPCNAFSNTLVLTDSTHGVSFYSGGGRVTFYQLEPDYFYPGRMLTGIGRYLLFRILRPTPRARLEISLSTTVRPNDGNRLPPAVGLAASRSPFPIVGRGSARVFSAPLKPALIGGQPYVMLDLGRDATLTPIKRAPIQGLFGSDASIDSRFLTAFARNISLISENDYRHLAAPTSVRRFPQDLGNADLEYSGMYEDGWVAERSYAMLSSKAFRTLVVRARVLPRPGQRLDVFVDGRKVASRREVSGDIDLRIPVGRSAGRRRVELRWAVAKPLSDADRRPAAARLTFLGFAFH